MRISVVIGTMRPWMYENIVRNIARQTRQPDKVILVYNKTSIEPNVVLCGIRDLGIPFVYQRASDYWGCTGMNRICYDMGCPDSEVMCLFDDDDWYGKEYIQEVESVFKAHPEAVLTGKGIYRMAWVNHEHPPVMQHASERLPDGQCFSMAGSTISVNSDIWRSDPRLRIDPFAEWGDKDIIEKAKQIGPIYDTGPYNFMVLRYQESHNHTWKVNL